MSVTKTDIGPEHSAPENPYFDSSFDEFAGVFTREDQVVPLARRGADYEYELHAFRWGFKMANADDFRGREWPQAEPELRRKWDSSRMPWQEARAAIREGGDEARGLG